MSHRQDPKQSGKVEIQVTELVTGNELEVRVGVSRTTLWRLRQQGLPHVRIGRGVRYDVREVLAWLASDGSTEMDPAQLALFRENGASAALAADHLEPCHWSPSVALDPKHRPQTPFAPSTTVRMEWRRFPQEAHLLDLESQRYRRLTPSEIAVLQGFPKGWGDGLGLTDRERIAGLGNAVPPPLAEALIRELGRWTERPPETTVELCAGFGGLALGASAAGLEHLALVDSWPAAGTVLRESAHWSPEAVQVEDVRSFDWGALAGQVDVLTGGPPCQPWSQAGRGRGEADSRDLLGYMPEVIQAVGPDAFLFENVPGLLNEANRPYLEWVCKELSGSGGQRYAVAVGIFQAADFGVPQRRRRVLIVGLRNRQERDALGFFDGAFARRTHLDPRAVITADLPPWRTISDAIPTWGDPKYGWRRWIGSEKSAADGRGESLEPSGTGRRSESGRRHGRVGLTWPDRGASMHWGGEGWEPRSGEDGQPERLTLPLLSESSLARAASDPWYVRGSQLDALSALRPLLRRRTKLFYMEAARLRTDLASFAAADRRKSLSTWLSLTQATLLGAIPLLSDDGVLTVLCGADEQPYLQLLLDELLGPGNRVGSVVWQKGYAPQNFETKDIYQTHDFLLIYAKRKDRGLRRVALKVPPKGFKNADEDPRGPWKADQKGANYRRESTDFEVNLAPYRWELVGGELPPGVWRVSPKSGVIWGDQVIAEPSDWPVRVAATDSVGTTAEKDFTIRVRDAGDAPVPQPPAWLVAGENDPSSEGDLEIVTEELPVAVSGLPYFACLAAKGGAPVLGTTRPGKNSESGTTRYWDYSHQTLRDAAAQDAVDFKSKDDAIPAIKVYLAGAEYSWLNQISTWPGGGKHKKDPLRVGYGQDAKKELVALQNEGLVDEVTNIAKPSALMTRLLGLFTEPDDWVVDTSSPGAEMASMATALGRRSVYIEAAGDSALAEGLRIPRLRLAARGRHPIPEAVLFTADDGATGGYYMGTERRGPDADADVHIAEVGPPFARSRRATGMIRIDYREYPSGGDRFLQALASVEGLIPMDVREPPGVFARSVEGTTLAVHIDGKKQLDRRTIEDVLSGLRSYLGVRGNKVRIYYHRGYDEAIPLDDRRVECRLVPTELLLAAGI